MKKSLLLPAIAIAALTITGCRPGVYYPFGVPQNYQVAQPAPQGYSNMVPVNANNQPIPGTQPVPVVQKKTKHIVQLVPG